MLDRGGSTHTLSAVFADTREFEWERNADPSTLMLQSALIIGRQCFALALVLMQVFSSTAQGVMGTTSQDYLMNCNPEVLGFASSLYCEFSKAQVRCFPIVSTVVAVVVCAQLILAQRTFYVMLRHGVLIDFQNINPLRDPLFIWVSVIVVLALSHFAFHVVESSLVADDSDVLAGIITDSKRYAVFYGVPAFVFLTFLYLAYDVEWVLLPISKFWEEDPEWAHEAMSKIIFVNEAAAARASAAVYGSNNLSDKLEIQDIALAIGAQGINLREAKTQAVGGEDSTDVLPSNCLDGNMARAVKRKTKPKAFSMRSSLASDALKENNAVNVSPRDGDAAKAEVGMPRGQSLFYASRVWATRLLLDPRLQDAKSSAFRRAWWAFGSISLLWTVIVLMFFLLQIFDDLKDVASGQLSDAAAAAVSLCNLAVLTWVLSHFVDEVFPYRCGTQARPIGFT